MRRTIKKTMAILLAAVLAFSVLTVGVVSVSAEDTGMAVTVKSSVPEFFPTSTLSVDRTAEKLTVTYWFNLQDYFMVNNQWALSYDPNVLQYNEDDGVNETHKNNRTIYLVYKFPENTDGSMEFNPACEEAGVMKGNITLARGFECYNMGKLPFLSITFNIIDASAESTEVFLDMQVMQVRHEDAPQESTPVDFINHSKIVNNGVTFTADESYTAAYEGDFNAEYSAAPVKIDNFKAYIVNMVFGESLSMKFYVKSAVLDGYTDAYMVFTREGKQTIAQMEGPDSDGDYYFTFKSLYPQLVVDDINAELHAFKNGVEYYGDIYTDSGERYIKRCLEKYKSGSTLKYRNARTMYVDMAIYCGLMQKKMHHKDDTHLITDYLTAEQLSWASTSVETKNDRVFDYIQCENADTQWTASNIVFSDVVVTKAYFKTNSIAGKTVKVTFDGRESTYTEADFIHDSSCDADEYYIEFGDLFARQMSTLCYFTVYNASGTACSPTMQYSIDSYATIIHNHPKYQGQEIDLICQAMVKYGHSVYKYLYEI